MIMVPEYMKRSSVGNGKSDCRFDRWSTNQWIRLTSCKKTWDMRFTLYPHQILNRPSRRES